MSRKSAIRPIYPAMSVSRKQALAIPSRFFASIGKSRQLAKHHVTMARRNAFLDLSAAMERLRHYERAVALAKATGWFTHMSPVDVEPFMQRYRDAVETQMKTFRS